MLDRDAGGAVQPLILTLQLDEASQGFYEELRRRYFPVERNLIPAHVTLFHKLSDEEETVQTIARVAAGCAAFPLLHPAVRSIGRGVAVFFQAEPLVRLHAALSAAFEAQLIPQDKQRIRPHIVVQNKVEPEVARVTLAEVGAMQLPEPVAVGLRLWRYLGGPWEAVRDMPWMEQVQRQVGVSTALRRRLPGSSWGL